MHITSRDDDNGTRKKRLAQLRRGPGVFVYDGSIEDTISHPMPLLSGAKDVLLDSDGFPVTDASGRAVYKPSGKVVVDQAGKVVYGGTPRVERIKLELIVLRGIEFPEGVEIEVMNAALALKLRGMPGFDEIVAEEPGDDSPRSRPALARSAEIAGKPAPQRKRKKREGAEE